MTRVLLIGPGAIGLTVAGAVLGPACQLENAKMMRR